MGRWAFIDFTGQQFSDLKVLSYLGKNNNKQNIYNVECVCGKQIIAEASDLKCGKVKSCGCGKFRKAQENALKNLDLSAEKQIYRDYKYKATKIRNLEFTLEFNYFKKLLKQPCHYCGTKESSYYKPARKVNKEFTYFYNGVDRKDNDQGYIVENCVSCCKLCNQAKHLLNEQSFLEHINKISEFQKAKPSNGGGSTNEGDLY